MSNAFGSISVAWLLLTFPVINTVFAQDVPTKSVVIDQGVDRATLHRYNHTDQGTRIMPAAWLVALETVDGSGKLMATDNLRRLGFIVDGVITDERNPYSWPVGMTVSDPTRSGGIPVAGLNCAGCHTGQIDYKGAAIRIEGGQGILDFNKFIRGAFAALVATDDNSPRRAKFFAEAIKAGYPADRMEADFKATVAGLRAPAPSVAYTEEGFGRSDAFQGAVNRLFGTALRVPANLKPRHGPVAFPYLWDIWRLSWVQYNAFQAGWLSTSRNLTEVLGVLAEVNFIDAKTGNLNPEPERWKSSVQLDNLLWMEKTLSGLRAPVWPSHILGPIDQAKAERGKQLFTATCAQCHGIKELPNGFWDVTVIPLQNIGTDPNEAAQWSGYTYDASKLGLGNKMGVYEALTVAVNAFRKQLYADFKTPKSEQEADEFMLANCGYKARPLIGAWATPPFLHNSSVRTVFELLSDTRPAKFNLGSREFDPINLGYVDEGPAVFDTSISGNSNAGHWFTDDGTRPGWIGPKYSDEEKYALIEYLKAMTYDNYPSEKRAKMAVMPCENKKDWARKD